MLLVITILWEEPSGTNRPVEPPWLLLLVRERLASWLDTSESQKRFNQGRKWPGLQHSSIQSYSSDLGIERGFMMTQLAIVMMTPTEMEVVLFEPGYWS